MGATGLPSIGALHRGLIEEHQVKVLKKITEVKVLKTHLRVTPVSDLDLPIFSLFILFDFVHLYFL